MSILIKGMKMPSRCYDCTFSLWSNLHQTMACKRHGFDPCFEDHSREYYEKRANFCPLVEVPAPHGRLIDADELANKTFYSKTNAPYITYHRFVNAPTVIGAEDGDTE